MNWKSYNKRESPAQKYKTSKKERSHHGKKHYAILAAMLLCTPAFAQVQAPPPSASKGLVNLIPEKFRSFDQLTKNGRGATIHVTPGKSYLITLAAKLARPSTNPDSALRFAIQEKGKKGYRFFEWHKLTAENFTQLSLLYSKLRKPRSLIVVRDERLCLKFPLMLYYLNCSRSQKGYSMSRFHKIAHVLWHCQYHFAWTPKYRFRILDGDVKADVTNCIRSFVA